MKKTFLLILAVFLVMLVACNASTNIVDKAPVKMRGKVWSGTASILLNGITISGDEPITIAIPESGELDRENLPIATKYSATATSNTYTLQVEYSTSTNGIVYNVSGTAVFRLVNSSTLSLSAKMNMSDGKETYIISLSGILYEK